MKDVKTKQCWLVALSLMVCMATTGASVARPQTSEKAGENPFAALQFLAAEGEAHSEASTAISYPKLAGGQDYADQINQAREAARAFYEHGAVARGRKQAARPPAFSCAVAVRSKVVWADAFGFADLEQLVPATPLTKFRIGSVSKPITAAGAALLYDKGKLDFDAPIQKYVPEFPDKGSPITIRELLGHLGGIRHYASSDFGGLDENQKHCASLSEGLAFFKNDPLAVPPKTKWLYSSYGFNLAGVAMERASGQPYLTLMRENVFAPLGMTNTTGDEGDKIIAHRVRFYEVADDGAYQNAPFGDLSYKYPSGGLLSTPTDLVIFGSALIHPGFLKESTRRLLFTSQQSADGKDTGYGLGWQLKSDEDGGYETGLQIAKPRGERFFWHRGAVVGGHAALVIYPDSEVVAACAENTSLASVPISIELIRRIAGPFIARNASATTPQASEKSTPDTFAALQFLLGDWEALSKPGESGWTTFTREAQGRVIMRRNHAEYAAANGRPASTHDDLMLIYQEGTTLRADYFDNEGHIIRYTVTSSAEGQVTFIGDTVANAPRFRLSYSKLPSGNVSGKFEIAPPGKPDAFTQYLVWEAKRK